MLYYLHSVGAMVDPDTRVVHPLRTDGTPDLYYGMANLINDCDEEFFGELSDEDADTIASILIFGRA